MNKKIFLVTTIFLLFFTSFAFSAEITSPAIQENNQQLAQLNAKIVDLTNQITSLKTQNDEFQQNAFMKSDLQNLYDNLVNINNISNQDLLTSNIVLFIMAFAIFFILVGKNLLPTHKKEKNLVEMNEKSLVIFDKPLPKWAQEIVTQETNLFKSKIESLKKQAEEIQNKEKEQKKNKKWFNKPQKQPEPQTESLKEQADKIYEI